MRHLIRVVALAVVLLSGARQAPAQQADGWVGKRVVARMGTVLTVGRRVVDDPYGQAWRPLDDRAVVPVYRVERDSGPWLWLVPERPGTSGWVKADRAVLYDRAIDYFSGEIRRHPASAAAYLCRGTLWPDQDRDRVIADFSEAIRLQPRSAPAYLARSRAWEAKKDYVKALADSRAAVRLDPSVRIPYQSRLRPVNPGAIAGVAGFEATTEVDFSPVTVDGKPDRRGETNHDLAIHQTIAGAVDPSRIEPKTAEDFYYRGISWQEQKNYDKAIADFSEAIRLQPEAVAAHTARGDTWKSQGEYHKAIADYSAALRLVTSAPDTNGAIGPNPRNADLYRKRAEALREKGEPVKAIADYDEAIRLQPEDQRASSGRRLAWEALERRAAGWVKIDEFEKAIADYTDAIRFEPDEASCYSGRSAAWFQKGEFEKAIADIAEAIRLDPDDATNYACRATYEGKKKDHDKALADLTVATRLNARDVLTFVNRSTAATAKAKAAREVALAEIADTIQSPAANRPSGPPDEIGRRIAARVGYELITRNELSAAVEEKLAKIPFGYKPTPKEMKELTGQVLDMLIERSIIVQAAKKEIKKPAHLELFFEFADKAWREEELPPLLQQYGVKNESELKKTLAERGRSLDALRETYWCEFLARGYVEQKLKDKVKVTDAEVRADYDAHLDKYDRPAQCTWREVLIEVAKHPSRAAARSKAEAVLARLKTGEDFAAVARAESEGPSAAAGGLWETEPGGYGVEAVSALLESLPLGALSPIIDGPASVHIVRVDARRPAGPAAFAEVQEDIRSKLQRQKSEREMSAFIETLRKETPVTIFDDPGPGAPEP